MKKLTGPDIIVLLKSATVDDNVLREAQSLSKKDFHEEDILVNYFFANCPNGFNGLEKTAMYTISEAMNSVKTEIMTQGLRKAHNLLQNVRNASNDAVIMENIVSESNPEVGLDAQFKAAKLLHFLARYATTNTDKDILETSVNQVNTGKLVEASNNIRKVFAKMIPDKNIKTAFVTLKNQMGEGYQMCAKGIYQSGRPVPMAISNCRDYCVDARLNPDGTVGCNYVKWLNEHLITQEQAKNLFDSMPTKGQVTMNLGDGQRTKFPMSDQDPQDSKIIRKEAITKDITEKSWESKLEESHKDKHKVKVVTKTLASDSAIELLLKDCRDVFDEDDLDTLETRLREAMGE
jgi:hypothetical protein